MYIILIFVVILFLILDCIKKPSNIETFKVIYRSLDTCNKNNISDAINNIYNRVQHLKTNVNILNKQLSILNLIKYVSKKQRVFV